MRKKKEYKNINILLLITLTLDFSQLFFSTRKVSITLTLTLPLSEGCFESIKSLAGCVRGDTGGEARQLLQSETSC